ncbi:MAG: class I SAM-dependent methyltransferase, partial [Nitrospiria bacterium]
NGSLVFNQMKSISFTLCPLCQADQTTQPLALRDWGYGGPGCFSMVRCLHCGVRYLNPRPTPTQMATYYPSHYTPYKTAIEDEPWTLMRWMRRRKIVQKRRLVERFSKGDAGHILDLGCSTGIFLAEMKGAGWQAKGVELNAEAAAYAQRRFGLDVVVGRLLEVTLPIATFDVVTMWDVLEHTFEPLATLQQAHDLLKPGGIVACTVPNEHSFDRLLFGATWVGYDAPRHLTVFSPDTLRRALVKAGFQVLTLRCGFGGYFSFISSFTIWLNRNVSSRRVREALLRLVHLPGLRLPFAPFFGGLDWIGWGNELFVVGRKQAT